LWEIPIRRPQTLREASEVNLHGDTTVIFVVENEDEVRTRIKINAPRFPSIGIYSNY
jgi:hypothetical protein